MSLKVGIVGLPNVGKSTLFNALLKKRVALSANYPFATVEPNIGVVAVPDARLEELAELVAGPKKPPIVPAVVEFVDIAGLVKGAHKGEGLGNQFLSHIREVDAIIHVVRDFGDPGIIREGSISPDEDKLTVETELSLADLEVVQKLVDHQEKVVKAAQDPLEIKKFEILNKIKEALEEGKIVGNFQIGDERVDAWFKTLPLLTTKPVLYVYNVSEESIPDSVGRQILYGRERNVQSSLMICAKLEEELADLSEQERVDYLKELGVEETGLERLIKKAYSLLDLISFLTAGEKEVRAWTVSRGTKAPQAAGVIHTDFEKGFIRAQVIEYQKLIEAGSYAAAKLKGQLRMEGKDYVIRDGDVVEFFVGN